MDFGAILKGSGFVLCSSDWWIKERDGQFLLYNSVGSVFWTGDGFSWKHLGLVPLYMEKQTIQLTEYTRKSSIVQLLLNDKSRR